MRTRLTREESWFEANNRRGAGFAPYYSPSHCCVCGKRVKRGREWLLLTREASGMELAISHPDDAHDDPNEEISNMWVAPVGPDCLKNHPELRHAILQRKSDAIARRTVDGA